MTFDNESITNSDHYIVCTKYEFNSAPSIHRYGQYENYHEYVGAHLQCKNWNVKDYCYIIERWRKFNVYFQKLLNMKDRSDRFACFMLELPEALSEICICCGSSEFIEYELSDRKFVTFQYLQEYEIDNIIQERKEIGFCESNKNPDDDENIFFGNTNLRGLFFCVTSEHSSNRLRVCKNCHDLHQSSKLNDDILEHDILLKSKTKNMLSKSMMQLFYNISSFPCYFNVTTPFFILENSQFMHDKIQSKIHSVVFPYHTTNNSCLPTQSIHKKNALLAFSFLEKHITADVIHMIEHELWNISHSNEMAFDKYFFTLQNINNGDQCVIMYFTKNNNSCVCCDNFGTSMHEFEKISFAMQENLLTKAYSFRPLSEQIVRNDRGYWPLKGTFVEVCTENNKTFMCNNCLSIFQCNTDLIYIYDDVIFSLDHGLAKTVVKNFWLLDNFPTKVEVY